MADAKDSDPPLSRRMTEGGNPRQKIPPGGENRAARVKARALALVYVRIRMREIVDAVKAWDTCGRSACRQAGSCRTADVACFDECSDEIQERLTQLLEWSRFDGPFDDGQLDGVVAELRELGAPI